MQGGYLLILFLLMVPNWITGKYQLLFETSGREWLGPRYQMSLYALHLLFGQWRKVCFYQNSFNVPRSVYIARCVDARRAFSFIGAATVVGLRRQLENFLQ